jgi:hypothetical protein
MPFTIVCYHHADGHMARAPLHWATRADAVTEMCRHVERLARDCEFSEQNRQEAIAEAAETGRFVVLGIIAWAVTEIDRPDQPIIEIADRAVQLLSGEGQDNASREMQNRAS